MYPDDKHQYFGGTENTGDHDRLAAEIDALRERCAALKAANEIGDILIEEAGKTIGKLHAMVQQLHAIATNGHDDDTVEVTRANTVMRAADKVIGAPPAGDVSAPLPFTDATESKHAPDGLTVLSARDAAHDPNVG
jgi:hypothetical protein